MDLMSWIKAIGVTGFVDIALVTILIYTLLVWLHRTRRAALVILGILIVGGIYLVAQFFGLALTSTMLRGFFAVFLIALVVIFQEELRFIFEQVANWSLNRKHLLKRRSPFPASDPSIELLATSSFEFGRDRIGTLIVLTGKDSLVRHLDGGNDLNGRLSDPLLKSIFDPHSTGHDGAMVLENDVVTRFGCHLPLSKNHEKVGRGGTRHAAALGLSEVSDALCLVVSEERGTVSVARHGELRAIPDKEALIATLTQFKNEIGPMAVSRPWRDFLVKNWWQKAAAVAIAASLWLVLVHGAESVYRDYTLPVQLENVPPGVTVTRIDPPEVSVTFSAPRRQFLLLNTQHLKLGLDAKHLIPGNTPLSIVGSDLTFPEGLVFQSSDPPRVVITSE